MSTSKSRIEYLVAGTALFVSLSTLGVYVYQAKVMKEQQHVSVWPYVEWLTSNLEGYEIAARNKGVGPALIKKAEMRLDGRVVASNRELIQALLGPEAQPGFVNSTLEGRVLSPGEEVKPLRILGSKDGRAFEAKLREHHFELRITYASVYGDTWLCTGLEVQRLSVRQPSLY